jgi:hypothetical protein
MLQLDKREQDIQQAGVERCEEGKVEAAKLD